MSGNPNMLPKETSADYCRRMGWGIGTRIVGDEGYGPTTITITAVGQERSILAKADGRDESRWTLEHRDWQLADPAPTDHTAAIAEAAREYVAASDAHDKAFQFRDWDSVDRHAGERLPRPTGLTVTRSNTSETSRRRWPRSMSGTVPTTSPKLRATTSGST